MSIWTDALPVIAAAFADEEPVTYHRYGAGSVTTISAIVSIEAAQSFDGPGSTLRRITYEIAKSDLPFAPSKKDTFGHRARTWAIEDITSRDDVGAWQLIVTDAGPLP